VSRRELPAFLRQIDRFNPQVNAIVSLRTALAHAPAAFTCVGFRPSWVVCHQGPMSCFSGTSAPRADGPGGLNISAVDLQACLHARADCIARWNDHSNLTTSQIPSAQVFPFDAQVHWPASCRAKNGYVPTAGWRS